MATKWVTKRKRLKGKHNLHNHLELLSICHSDQRVIQDEDFLFTAQL